MCPRDAIHASDWQTLRAMWGNKCTGYQTPRKLPGRSVRDADNLNGKYAGISGAQSDNSAPQRKNLAACCAVQSQQSPRLAEWPTRFRCAAGYPLAPGNKPCR